MPSHKRNKLIIAFTGMPGSGKSRAARMLSDLGLPLIAFDNVRRIIDDRGLPQTNEWHKKIRTELRDRYGMHALAYLNLVKIKSELEKTNLVVIENMRSWEEYEYLRKELQGVKIYIIAVCADKRVRYARIKHRPDYLVGGEARDRSELIETNMGATIAFADYTVENSGTIGMLKKRLDIIYKLIISEK